MKVKRNQKGFTLIEVVLVLAIGGLIFLLAFLAFQQVSRNRRDTQRRSDAGKIIAELQNFKGDTGSFPVNNSAVFTSGDVNASFNTDDFVTSYLGGATFTSPSNEPYVWVNSTNDNDFLGGVAFAGPRVVQFRNNATCNGTGFQATTGRVAVRVSLEAGIVCRDDK